MVIWFWISISVAKRKNSANFAFGKIQNLLSIGAKTIPFYFKARRLPMNIEEGKSKFIEAWGTFAGGWGINRTMAQVHALLLISPHALTADQVMEELSISRGNVNMNIRALIDWGLVYKQLRSGDRKEYFYAEKDMWNVVKQIIIHRKKKELEPVLKVLEELSCVEKSCPQSECFCNTVQDIKLFSQKANSTLDMLIKADSNWFTGTFLKMIR